jgi:hypothetical protein
MKSTAIFWGLFLIAASCHSHNLNKEQIILTAIVFVLCFVTDLIKFIAKLTK